MQNKMLVLDIDGTLLTSQHTISDKTKQALKNLSQRGIYVVLASGRPTPGMLPLIQELELDQSTNYFISYNGAHLNHTQQDELLFADQLDAKTVSQFLEIADLFEASLITYNNDSLVVSRVNEWSTLEASLNHLTTKVATHITDFATPTPKMIIANDAEPTKKALSLANEKYGNDFQLSISMPCFLEVTSKTVDKALTLKRLCDHLNINISDVVTCGDGGNDITMIQAAGTGVAMGNANDTVKSHADYITATNDEDGIIEVIEKFFN
ncbi:MAG: Cof-type HAD-IIB family hydrolase [Culicoidibacterales bacterium]